MRRGSGCLRVQQHYGYFLGELSIARAPWAGKLLALPGARGLWRQDGVGRTIECSGADRSQCRDWPFRREPSTRFPDHHIWHLLCNLVARTLGVAAASDGSDFKMGEETT